jgi:hypothetical protein
MMCPNCFSDHLDGVVVCPECGVALVAALPDDHNVDLVEVWRGSDADELPFVESLLRDEGIEYVVDGDEAFGVLPLGNVSLTRILVRADQAESARMRLATPTPEPTSHE